MSEKDRSPREQAAGSAESVEQMESILGLPTSELAGLSVDEIVGNKTAVTMLIHYYKQRFEENVSLRNDLNTLKTYVDSYRETKQDARIGGILASLSTIFVGFGVNLITGAQYWPGWMMFVGGLALLVSGLYFSFRNQK